MSNPYICPNSICGHNFVLVEQRRIFKEPGAFYNLCVRCGHEKVLNDVCVIDIEHTHDYCDFRGCNNGFYIIRCKHPNCQSFLRVQNIEQEQEPINYNGKRRGVSEDFYEEHSAKQKYF